MDEKLARHALKEETDGPDSEMDLQSNITVVTTSTTQPITQKQVSKSTTTSHPTSGATPNPHLTV